MRVKYTEGAVDLATAQERMVGMCASRNAFLLHDYFVILHSAITSHFVQIPPQNVIAGV